MEPYGLLALLGDIGGLYSIIFAFFSLLVGTIVDFYFKASLLEETY